MDDISKKEYAYRALGEYVDEVLRKVSEGRISQAEADQRIQEFKEILFDVPFGTPSKPSFKKSESLYKHLKENL